MTTYDTRAALAVCDAATPGPLRQQGHTVVSVPDDPAVFVAEFTPDKFGYRNIAFYLAAADPLTGWRGAILRVVELEDERRELVDHHRQHHQGDAAQFIAENDRLRTRADAAERHLANLLQALPDRIAFSIWQELIPPDTNSAVDLETYVGASRAAREWLAGQQGEGE